MNKETYKQILTNAKEEMQILHSREKAAQDCRDKIGVYAVEVENIGGKLNRFAQDLQIDYSTLMLWYNNVRVDERVEEALEDLPEPEKPNKRITKRLRKAGKISKKSSNEEIQVAYNREKHRSTDNRYLDDTLIVMKRIKFKICDRYGQGGLPLLCPIVLSNIAEEASKISDSIALALGLEDAIEIPATLLGALGNEERPSIN